MVDHDHDRIEAGGVGEVRDQIDGELGKGAGRGGGNRHQRRGRGVHVALHLLAESTAINIPADKSTHTGPPKVTLDKPIGLVTTRVPGGGVIVVEKKNMMAQVGRNISMVSIIKGAVLNPPIREGRTHRGCTVTVESLGGGSNNGVGRGVIVLQ